MSNQSVSSFKTFLVKHKVKILEVGIGRSIYTGFNFLFDDILWPLMIVWLGWKGSAIMSSISLVQCALVLIWYQRKGRDWLGVSIMEEAKASGHETIRNFLTMKTTGIKTPLLLIVKLFSIVPIGFLWIALWLMNKSKTLAFFGLGMIQDPFEVTAYFKGADFTSPTLTKRDWILFFASWLWINIYWNGRSWITALLIILGINAVRTG